MLASENQGDRGCQSQVGVAPELLRAAQSSLTTVFRRCALNICRDSPLNIAQRHTCITQGTNRPLGAWGFKRTEVLFWGGYSITARFAVSCTLLLKHLVLVTVGHRTLEELGPWIALAMLFQWIRLQETWEIILSCNHWLSVVKLEIKLPLHYGFKIKHLIFIKQTKRCAS